MEKIILWVPDLYRKRSENPKSRVCVHILFVKVGE